jgi:hypothetical protein
MLKEEMRTYAIILAVGLVAGYGLGYLVTRPRIVMETYKPPIRQADGSLILERKPDAKAKPKQAIPKGDKLERVVQVEVETLKPETKVRVDLSLVSEPDGSKRVIASSPDGAVTGGFDIPTIPVVIPKTLNWSAGAVYSPVKRQYGGFVTYRKGPYVAQVVVVGDNILVGAGINF